MSNKDKVERALLDLSSIMLNQGAIGVTTGELSETLRLKRNHVSHLLNRLVDDHIAIKTNSRPVYYIHKNKINDIDTDKIKLAYGLKKEQKKTMKQTPFKKLIGYNGSLEKSIELCKSAALYPPNGLPILITGDSGVGKSYIAELIYEYAIYKKKLEQEAKFVVFNCAEYADNDELISSAIFGHKKGAFTGAISDKKGLLEESDGGVLFLDEIHRLKPKSQEKLFLFLDKGIFRPLGESVEWKSSNVRLVFATTKKPQNIFLETFIRRIPLVVDIPNYNSRPEEEKLNLIRYFYWQESQRIEKSIEISPMVVKALVKSHLPGNIGRLKNTISLSCARSLSQSMTNKPLKIDLKHITKDYISQYHEYVFDGYNYKEIIIDYKEDIDNIVQLNINPFIRQNVDYIIEAYKALEWSVFLNRSYAILNELIEFLVFDDNGKYKKSTFLEVIKKIVNYGLNDMNYKYSLEFQGNSIEVITYLIDFLKDVSIYDHEIKHIIKCCQKHSNQSFKLAQSLSNLLCKNLECSVSDLTLVYLCIYFEYINRSVNKKCNAIIMAHGYATASSISSVANRLLDEYVFDAIDMPLKMPISEIGDKLKSYIEGMSIDQDLLILVDMGSLENIYDEINDIFSGSIGIINNISTQLALNIGESISQEKSVEEIMNDVKLNNQIIKSNFFKSKRGKKKSILITCSTGIGTANKIKSLIKPCFKHEDVEVISSDYYMILENQLEADIFKKKDVRLILGTNNPKISRIPYLSIEELILDEADEKLFQVLKGFVAKETIDRVIGKIVELFTLENVLNNVSILNPRKITNQVRLALDDLEKSLKLKLTNKHRISLIIHICCMIERLIVKDPITSYYKSDTVDIINSDFYSVLKDAFKIVEREYNVDIPKTEIAYIYDNIALRIPNIKILKGD